MKVPVYYVAQFREGLPTQLHSGPYNTEDEARRFCISEVLHVVTHLVLVEWTYEVVKDAQCNITGTRYVGA